MVCWQQAKMLYKYSGSLHTRMRTHTPPDEQNQSSGTAELRVSIPLWQARTGGLPPVSMSRRRLAYNTLCRQASCPKTHGLTVSGLSVTGNWLKLEWHPKKEKREKEKKQ